MRQEAKSPGVKKAAVYVVEDIEDEAAVPILLDIAMNDKDVRLRADAISALGEIGTPKAREALMKVIEKKK